MTAARNDGMSGILAIWNDRAAAVAADYERWYMGEHIPERLAVPGFRAARRYEAVAADRPFFTFYELDAPDVLTSPAYRARLNDPTPATRAMMPHFRAMARSAMVETVREGRGIGGAAVTVRYAADAPADLPRAAMRAIEPAEITAARLWRAAPGAAPTDTVEGRMRPGADEVAAGAVVIETARAAAAERLAAALADDAVDGAIGCYRLLCVFNTK
jgi:hypothetical protein